MKQYILVKEYPNCPKLGTIIEEPFYKLPDRTMIPAIFLEEGKYNEFWKLIEEDNGKDYEILSFKVIRNNNIRILKEDGLYWFENQPLSYENLIKNNSYQIYSIKRLSDNEIFTIGDTVSATDNIYTGGYFRDNILSDDKSGNWSNEFYNTKIKNFKTIDNKLCIIYNVNCDKDYGQPIEFVKKIEVKQPIFTTEDGVDIFEGDKYWFVTPEFQRDEGIASSSTRFTILKCVENKRFSTKDKAEEYIINNKPCLSFNDLKNLVPTSTIYRTKTISLIKQKLNL